ncbi:MAG TPA: RNA methyltransferase [Burkholderiales bacterium]|nr:RNA methyltransferase [Burkholderiales bacterium]
MSNALKNSLANCRIVLCETHHAGNIGAAARAMKTMGLDALVLVAPENYPSAEATRRASRATDVLARAQICATLEEALAGTVLAVGCSARTREMAAPEIDARGAALRLAAVAAKQPVALVFGNETYGLTNAQVSLCQMIATIPADPQYASLNLAAAVQVFAYELRLAALRSGGDALEPGNRSKPLASHEAVEGFYAHLESALVETGYLNSHQPKKLMLRLRRLYARAKLEQEEVNILRGVVRTLRQPKNK